MSDAQETDAGKALRILKSGMLEFASCLFRWFPEHESLTIKKVYSL